jgi:hypothetical protein
MFMSMRRLIAIAAALLLATVHVAEADDALKARVMALARTVTPNDFAFTRTARVEQTTGDQTETRVTVEKFDPRKPGEQRWTLVSVDGRAPTADELQAHAKGVAETPRHALRSRGGLLRCGFGDHRAELTPGIPIRGVTEREPRAQ